MARTDNALAIAGPLIKSLVFAVVGLFILAVLYIQLGAIRFQEQRTYSAILSSGSGLLASSTVSAVGVQVGRVNDVELYDNNKAKVTFTIDAARTLTDTTRATVRYQNLTGDQYLDLTPGPVPGNPLPAGGTIPMERTTPSLDLDVLLAGFHPLFEGLEPGEVNKLSSELISVLQGEGGTLTSLLGHIASLTGALADRDQVIGSVINNLNTVLRSVDAHSGQLSDTVLRAQQLVTALSNDRHELVEGVRKTTDIADQVGDLLAAIRSGNETYHELGRVAEAIDEQGEEFDRILSLAPGAYLRLGRVASGGAAYQIYICHAYLKLTGPDGKPFFTPQMGASPNIERCKAGGPPLQGEKTQGPGE